MENIETKEIYTSLSCYTQFRETFTGFRNLQPSWTIWHKIIAYGLITVACLSKLRMHQATRAKVCQRAIISADS